MNEMPGSWALAKIADLFEKIVDGSHNPPGAAYAGLPMLSARNISNDGLDLSYYRTISDADFIREHARTRVEAGDVLLTIVGSIGRSYAVRKPDGVFTLQRSVAVLGSKSLSSRYCALQFRG